MFHQSDHAKRLKNSSQALQAGINTVSVFTYDFKSAYAAGEVIEMGQLATYAQLLSVKIVGTGLGAATADIGFVTGTFGDKDDTRTCDNSIMDDGTSAFDVADVNVCLGITPDNINDKTIGVTLSAAVAAGAGTLKLVVEHVHLP